MKRFVVYVRPAGSDRYFVERIYPAASAVAETEARKAAFAFSNSYREIYGADDGDSYVMETSENVIYPRSQVVSR